jgi:(1->4)-alpha-D-glucan 1-alpha-D-glucosylmutase
VLRATQLRNGVRIQLRDGGQQPLSWRITEESGETRQVGFTPLKLALIEEREHEGERTRAFALPLPAELPEGYHRLALFEGDTLLGQGMVVVVPQPLPPAAGARGRRARLGRDSAALRVALRAQRRHRRLLGAARRRGGVEQARRGDPRHQPAARAVDARPGTASPYSPSSRLFFNPLYIDVEAVADFDEIAAVDPQVAGALARAGRHATRHGRGRLWRGGEGEARDVRAPLRELPHAPPRARLAAGARLHPVPRDPRAGIAPPRAARCARRPPRRAVARLAAGIPRSRVEGARRFCEEHADRVGLHEYLQWIAHLQLGAAQARCLESGMPIGLYADLAISIAPDGSEAWANQKLYALGVHVGAPPDEFNTVGQDWGLPPLSPERCARPLRAAGRDAARQHESRRAPAHRPRDGPRAPVVGAARHEAGRGRVRALPGRRPARHRALESHRNGAW